jgi:biopolymer transport protein ExbB/TolQ
VKRAIYLVVAALASMAVIVAPAAAQGENVQQALQNAQERVQAAQQYMESPEGQQALQEAQDNLQQARDNVQQQGQQAREGAQQKIQEVTSKMESKMEGTSLVKSGGVPLSDAGLLVPAVALLLGAGVIGYGVLRRR